MMCTCFKKNALRAYSRCNAEHFKPNNVLFRRTGDEKSTGKLVNDKISKNQKFWGDHELRPKSRLEHYLARKTTFNVFYKNFQKNLFFMLFTTVFLCLLTCIPPLGQSLAKEKYPQ